jgi:uncharacterized protein (TIGR03067 family)
VNTTLFAGLALTLAAPALKERPSKPPTVEGEWTVVEDITGGKPARPPRDGPVRITISDGVWECSTAGAPAKWRIAIDLKKSPGEIDFLPDRAGPPTYRGIVKVDRDSLVVCYQGGEDRPTEFASPPGSKLSLLTLRREKPADAPGPGK